MIQSLKDKNILHTLARAGREVHPMQHLREMLQNSIEAGATEVEFKEEPQHAQMGVKKFMFSDNGCGMTPSQMYEFIGKYNSSSKATSSGYHDNFGIGVKVTTAHFNPYGVVYLSWHPDYPDGNMVWFGYDDAEGVLGLKSVSYREVDDEGIESIVPLTQKVQSDEGTHKATITANVISLKEMKEIYEADSEDLGCFFEGDYGLVRWWDCKPSFINDHGTVVILLGKSAQDSSWLDSHGNAVTYRDVTGYFNTRYLDLPSNITLRSPQHFVNPLGFKGALNKIESEVPGFIEHTESHVLENGFEVTVYVTKTREELEASGSNRHQLQNHFNKNADTGFVALEYKGELYNYQSGLAVLRKWGFTADSLAKKTKIIVTPPLFSVGEGSAVKAGVFPNEGRDRLLWGGGEKDQGKEIILTHTINLFRKSMSEDLLLLIDSSIENTPRPKDNDLIDKIKEYDHFFKGKPFKGQTIKKNAQGTTLFDTNEATSKGTPKSASTNQGTNPSSSSTGTASPKGKNKGLPSKGRLAFSKLEMRWVSHGTDHGQHDFRGEGGYIWPVYAQEEAMGRFKVFFNSQYSEFRELHRYFCDKFGVRLKNAQHAVLKEIKEEYELQIGSFIYHNFCMLQRDDGLVHVDRDSFWDHKALYSNLMGSPRLMNSRIEKKLTYKFKVKKP